MQIDNINTIEYLKQVFKKLNIYSVDISEYQYRLNNIINEYENSKLKEIKRENTRAPYITSESVPEIKLQRDLVILKFDLEYYNYINLLDLINSTNNWDLSGNIDDIFRKTNIETNHSFLENFSNIDIQKLIIDRYYKLLLKKIIIDYNKKVSEYLNKYNNLNNFPKLKETVKNLLNDKNLSINIDLDKEDYTLETVIKAINKKINCNISIKKSRKDNNKYIRRLKNNLLTLKKLLKKTNNIAIFYPPRLTSFIRKVSSKISTTLNKTTYKNSIRNIFTKRENKNSNSKVIKNKLVNYNDYFLKKKENHSITNETSNFINKNINYNPTKKIDSKIPSIKNNDISDCNLENIDLQNIEFNNIIMFNTNLKNTNAKIDPQKVNLRMMSKCNFENLDFRDKNFDGVYLSEANLRNTRARINPQTVKNKNLSDCILEGCYVINNFIGYRTENMPNLNGAILVNSFEEIDKIEENMLKFNNYYEQTFGDNITSLYNIKDNNKKEKSKTYIRKAS